MIHTITQQERSLLLTWTDGRQSTFHYLWLRDNCPSPATRHPSGQRLLETTDIPDDVRPASVALANDGGLTIAWTGEDHVSHFTPAWLQAHDYSRQSNPQAGAAPILWDATLDQANVTHDYAAVQQDRAALCQWLTAVRDYGFAILRNVPPRPGMVTEVVSLFGYVRETNYGRLFDVKSVANPSNLAYTGLALSAHTDNPYRDPVPTVQLLHCLQSEVEGGDSIVVDGFHLIEQIRCESPEDFRLLATQPLRFHFRDAETDLWAETPLILLDAHDNVCRISFNNRSVQPFNFAPEVMEEYYRAYRAFGRGLHDPANQVVFKLEPGDLFIVDNRRVLHGRTGYASSGTRHLQGCYADMDSLLSRLRVLAQENNGEQ